MTESTVVETRDQVWSPVLEGLTAKALDCIQTGLAALADRHHGSGAHLVLGARLGFTVRGNPPSVEVPVEQRLAEARELTGLRVVEHRDGLDGPALRRFAADAGPLFVVGDAFGMAWTPYRGQRHLEHSVLLVPSDDRFLVVDPYHIETEWGVARPSVWRLSIADVDSAFTPGASAMAVNADCQPELDTAAILARNAETLADAEPEITRYVAMVRAGLDPGDALDQFVLNVWLLGRSRLLHATWLATVDLVPAPLAAEADDRAQDWLRFTAESYVGMRRAQLGSPLPPSVVERLAELLGGDIEFAARLARAVAVSPEIRVTVEQAVRTVLRLDNGALSAAQAFRALPNFNSFRLVDIVELVETTLGVRLDADDLTGDALHDVDSMALLFARAARRARR
jgi:hypothetical protein